MFYFFFIIRRLIFVTVAFNWDDPHIVLQLFAVLYMNIFFVIYQGSVKPLASRFNNRLELFNEFLVGCCSFYTMCFTDWILSKKVQAHYGYHMIFIIGVLISTNVLVILYFSGRSILFLMYKGYLNAKMKLDRLKTQIKEKFSPASAKVVDLEVEQNTHEGIDQGTKENELYPDENLPQKNEEEPDHQELKVKAQVPSTLSKFEKYLKIQ